VRQTSTFFLVEIRQIALIIYIDLLSVSVLHLSYLFIEFFFIVVVDVDVILVFDDLLSSDVGHSFLGIRFVLDNGINYDTTENHGHHSQLGVLLFCFSSPLDLQECLLKLHPFELLLCHLVFEGLIPVCDVGLLLFARILLSFFFSCYDLFNDFVFVWVFQ
jgi:hypothetical protein